MSRKDKEMIAALNDTIEKQKAVISLLKEECSVQSEKFTYVRPPADADMRSYHEKRGEFGTNEFNLFWMSRIKEEAWQAYTRGAITGDECKGRLATVNTILSDSKMSRSALEVSADAI